MNFAKTQTRGKAPICHDATPARGDTAPPRRGWLEVAATSMQDRCKVLTRATGVAKSAFRQIRPVFRALPGREVRCA